MKPIVRNSLLTTVAILLVLSMFAWGGLATPVHAATLTVPNVFTNDAILQRNMAVPVWGTAAAGAQVTVNFNGQVKTTNAASDGKWRVNLDPMATLATPSNMIITSGSESITLTGIQVGEVWVGGGQSNMSRGLTYDSDEAAAVASASSYNLRFFDVTTNGSSAVWQVADATSAPNFSAVLFFFGRYLAQQMPGVPIGLMSAAKACTAINTWSTDVGSGTLYSSMVKPMQPYAIRGVTWYQGEWDAKSVSDAEAYYTDLPTLINNWRTDWGQGNFPFYIIQLPRQTIAQVHIIRDAELHTALTVPNTDISFHLDYPEINVHPSYKQSFGERQAYLALKNIYGFNIVESGPYATAALSSIQGSQIVVGFEHIGSGLKTGGSSLAEWQVASAPGGTYVNATAQIVGNTVVVSSTSVPNPACVRYAFSINPPDPTTFLYNMEGLGASPIRELCPGTSSATATPGPSLTPTITRTPGPSNTPTNTPLPPTVTPTSGGAQVIHVEDIYTTDASGNPLSTFIAGAPIYYRVKIVDQFSAPVSGATVTTAILKPGGVSWVSQSGTTGADGWVLLNKPTTKNQTKGLYTINITNVTKSGSTYNSGANVKSSTTFTLQ